MGIFLVSAVVTIVTESEAVLFLVTLAVLLRFKKVPEPLVVLAAAVIGLVLYPLVRG